MFWFFKYASATWLNIFNEQNFVDLNVSLLRSRHLLVQSQQDTKTMCEFRSKLKLKTPKRS